VGGVSQEVVNSGRKSLEVENEFNKEEDGAGVEDDGLSVSDDGSEGWEEVFAIGGLGNTDLSGSKILDDSGQTVGRVFESAKGFTESVEVSLEVSSHGVGKLRA